MSGNLLGLFNWLILWTETHPVLAWLVLYLLILVMMQMIGWVIGSWKFGLIMGIAVINGVSIAYATIAFQSQPMWITALIFLFSWAVIISLAVNRPLAVKEKR